MRLPRPYTELGSIKAHIVWFYVSESAHVILQIPAMSHSLTYYRAGVCFMLLFVATMLINGCIALF